jgi:hypothetical protein
VEVQSDGPFASSSRGKTRAQKEGLRYEKRVLKLLEKKFKGEILYQPWLNFADANGEGWARPDFLLTPVGRERHRIILDAKLTATTRAEAQVRGLYLPLFRALLRDSEFTTLQVALNPAGMRTKVLTLEDVLSLPPDPVLYFWHWIP